METLSASLHTPAPAWPRSGCVWTLRQPSLTPLSLRKNDEPSNADGTPPQDFDEIKDDKASGRWFRCVACRTPIAQPKHLCQINSQSSTQSFLNPHGIVHQLRTFSAVNHYKLAGSPTPGDSWFPGYWWLYLLCETCHSHLGWAYFTPQSTQIDFFGVRTMAVELG